MRDSRGIKTMLAEIFFMLHYDAKNQNDQLVEILMRYNIIDDKMIKRRNTTMMLFKTLFDAIDELYPGMSMEEKQSRIGKPETHGDKVARDLGMHYSFSRSALFVGDKEVYNKFLKVVAAVKNVVSPKSKEAIEAAEKAYRKTA